MRRRYLLIFLAPVALLVFPLLAACTSANSKGLPQYAYHSDAALEGYQIAVAERELLTQLPCYCGCGDGAAHENLRDCFLNGEGQFNSHAAYCLICLEETKDASRWQEEGLSPKQIRELIDQKYEGWGSPTDTPPILKSRRRIP